MNYFILFLLIVIIIISLNQRIESFKCINLKLLKPLKIGFNKLSAFKIDKKKRYIDTNLITTRENIDKLIKRIPIKKSKFKYIEYQSYNNNYYKIRGNTIDKKLILNYIKRYFNFIKPILIKNSEILFPKLCNKYTNCKINLIDSRVKLIGYNNKGNIAIEGQVLIKFNISSFKILLDFVVSNENKFTVHYTKLSGINIFDKPGGLINNLKFIDGSNPKIMTKEVKNFNKKNRNQDEIYKFSYSCFGRDAITKSNCENLYYKTSKPSNTIGVWDKKCEKDIECPFFKANKNYPNNFGKCNNGQCELPLGAIRISPRKFSKDSILLCHNCLDGSNCCEQQKDKKLYPNLKSPDYMFLEDQKIRKNYKIL